MLGIASQGVYKKPSQVAGLLSADIFLTSQSFRSFTLSPTRFRSTDTLLFWHTYANEVRPAISKLKTMAWRYSHSVRRVVRDDRTNAPARLVQTFPGRRKQDNQSSYTAVLATTSRTASR